MLVRCSVLSLFLAACSAQNLSVGFAGGGALSNAFETINAGVPQTTTSYSQAKDYVVGLMLEYRLAGNFSLQGDVLYRETHLTVAFVEPNRVRYGVSPAPVVTWEMPLMAKYRFHWWKVDPFVEAGPAFRPTSNLNANPSHYGVTAGVGVTTRWKRFEISPMVRYSRWMPERRVGNLAKSEADQVELLIGLSSRPRSAWHPLSARIALGLIAGTTVLHDVPATTFASGSDVSLMGPAMEVALLKGLSLEIDAYYHPIDVSRRRVLSEGVVVDAYSGAEGRTWEFPVLGKYKFGTGRFKPFVEAGPSFRLLTENSSLFGMGGGAGVEMRLRSLKIAPRLRFTHWGAQGYHSPATGVVVNQVEFLASFLL